MPNYEFQLFYENYGPFRSVVSTINDPDGRYRLKANEPKCLCGETDWAEPYGFDPKTQSMPERGDFVWIHYIGGALDNPIWVRGPIKQGDANPEHELFPPSDDGNTINVRRGKTGNEIGMSDLGGISKTWLSSSNSKLELYNDAPLYTVTEDVKANIGALLTTLRDLVIKANSCYIDSSGKLRLDAGSITVVSSGDSTESVIGDKIISATGDMAQRCVGDYTISCAVDPTGEFTIEVGPPNVPLTKISMTLDKIIISTPLSPLGNIEISASGVQVGTGGNSIASDGDSYVVGVLGVQMVKNILNQGIHTVGVT